MRKEIICGLSLFAALFIFAACGDDTTSDSEAGQSGDVNSTAVSNMSIYDLDEFGIPVSFHGPSGVMVTVGHMQDLDSAGQGLHHLLLKKGSYVVQVTMVDVLLDAEETVENNFRDVMDIKAAMPGFELLEEAGTGAVFRSDEGYDFFFTMVKNGVAISFSKAATDEPLAEEDVRTMLAACKDAV